MKESTAGSRLRVLILEDNLDDAELVLRELRRGGFDPDWERVDTAEDFAAALTKEWDVILSDFSMPRFNAFGALDLLEGRRNSPPFIVVSGTIGEDTAVAAIKAGAADYLMKDRLARLAPTIRRELRDRAVRRIHETDRRRAEEAIQTLFTAVEQTVDSIVMTDAEGKITYVNPGFQRLYGYGREEVLGKTPRVLKSGQHDEPYYRSFWAALTSGQGFRGEIVNKSKDGRLVIVEISAKAIFDESGKRTGFIAVHHDVTEKTRAEETLRASEAALRASEQRLLAIIETEPECVKTVDRRGRITHMNRAGLAMLEADSLEEVQRRDILDFLLPEYRAPFSALHERVMKGEMGRLEFEVTGLKGTRRWLDTHAVPLRDAGGEISNLLGITRDITEKKRAEQELRESQEQLRALSAHLQTIREEERTGIARELHDELGQALTALKMDLASMKRHLASGKEGSSDSAARKVDSILGLIDGMVTTVRRISSDLRPGMLDDLGLLPAIEWLAQDFSDRTGIACRVRSEVESLALDRARSTAIFRIFQETLTNVARHSKATEVAGRIREEGGVVELEVRDNGQGFAPPVLHGASSLGLIGMRERANSAGGSIEFVSKPGEGVTMRLRVPTSAPGQP